MLYRLSPCRRLSPAPRHHHPFVARPLRTSHRPRWTTTTSCPPRKRGAGGPLRSGTDACPRTNGFPFCLPRACAACPSDGLIVSLVAFAFLVPAPAPASASASESFAFLQSINTSPLVPAPPTSLCMSCQCSISVCLPACLSVCRSLPSNPTHNIFNVRIRIRTPAMLLLPGATLSYKLSVSISISSPTVLVRYSLRCDASLSRLCASSQSISSLKFKRSSSIPLVCRMRSSGSNPGPATPAARRGVKIQNNGHCHERERERARKRGDVEQGKPSPALPVSSARSRRPATWATAARNDDVDVDVGRVLSEHWL